MKEYKLPSQSPEHHVPQDPEDTQWTTVRCRRARSLGSLERVQKNHSKINTVKKLTMDQVQTVETAAQNLTEDGGCAELVMVRLKEYINSS